MRNIMFRCWGRAVVEIIEICEKTAKYEKRQKIRWLLENTCAGDQARIDVFLLKYASTLLGFNQRIVRLLPQMIPFHQALRLAGAFILTRNRSG